MTEHLPSNLFDFHQCIPFMTNLSSIANIRHSLNRTYVDSNLRHSICRAGDKCKGLQAWMRHRPLTSWLHVHYQASLPSLGPV